MVACNSQNVKHLSMNYTNTEHITDCNILWQLV